MKHANCTCFKRLATILLLFLAPRGRVREQHIPMFPYEKREAERLQEEEARLRIRLAEAEEERRKAVRADRWPGPLLLCIVPPDFCRSRFCLSLLQRSGCSGVVWKVWMFQQQRSFVFLLATAVFCNCLWPWLWHHTVCNLQLSRFLKLSARYYR